MSVSNDETKASVSGSGVIASTGGVAAGNEGIAIGGDVLGNVMKVVNFVTILGGTEGAGKDILRNLGVEIKTAIDTGVNEPDDLMRLIRLPVEKELGEKPTNSLINYLQIAGKTFGSLVDKYEKRDETDVFLFGDFLKDMIGLIGTNEIVARKAFDAFGTERSAVNSQDLGLVFAVPSKYESLELPQVDAVLKGKLQELLPHPSPLYLYRRAGIWSEHELYLGHFYHEGNSDAVCPLRFQGRDIIAYRWQKGIDYVFFGSLASALLADFILYVHKLQIEQSTARHVLDVLRKFRTERK